MSEKERERHQKCRERDASMLSPIFLRAVKCLGLFKTSFIKTSGLWHIGSDSLHSLKYTHRRTLSLSLSPPLSPSFLLPPCCPVSLCEILKKCSVVFFFFYFPLSLSPRPVLPVAISSTSSVASRYTCANLPLFIFPSPNLFPLPLSITADV